MSIRLTAAAIAGCLILPLAVTAQQPTRAVRFASTRSEAERAPFEQAAFELANIGGARSDRLFQQILTSTPDFGLARALWAATSPNLALADRQRELAKAVQDAAGASAPELMLAAALREWRAGRTPAALTLLDAAAHLLPGEPLIEVLRIQLTTDLPEQLRLAEAANLKFPDEAGILNMLAYSRYRNGFRTEGLELAKRYVQLQPDHPNAHDTYAELLHHEGDLALAEQEYRKAIALDAGWFGGHVGLANIALTRSEGRAAIAHMETAVATSREPVERLGVLRQAAFAAAVAGDAAAMRRHFAQAIAAGEAANVPSYVRDTRLWLASMEAALGNRAQVEAVFADPRHNQPAYAYIGLTRAMAFALVGDLEQVDAGIAEQERASAAANYSAIQQESVHLARLVRATAANDLATAKSELAHMKTPSYVVAGNAYLARALKAAKDTKGAEAAKTAALSYLTLDGVRATALLITR